MPPEVDCCATLQVPYQDLPFLFFGEEQAMLAHMWTHGYDMYAPPRSVAWHQWSRSQRSTFHSCVPQVGLPCASTSILSGTLPALEVSRVLGAAVMLGLALIKATAPDTLYTHVVRMSLRWTAQVPIGCSRASTRDIGMLSEAAGLKCSYLGPASCI